MTALIDIRHISYAYPTPGRNTPPALNDLSLQIAAGDYVAIVGANGSGKSTLARHLNALLVPDDGYVRVGGLNTRDRAHHTEIRRTVGMVFQRPEDQIVATVVEHDVAFGLENLGLDPDIIRARVEDTLKAVSLWGERERPPHMLSAGQMQRLALAGILAMRPDCIVFDEATAMLDPVGRQATRQMMRDLNNDGLTILTITHRMDEALDADRVVVLDHGRVALDDVPARIFRNAEVLHRLGLDVPSLAKLATALRRAVPDLPEDATTVTSLVGAIDAYPHRTTPITQEPPAPPAQTMAIVEAHGLSHTYMRGTPFARQSLDHVDIAVHAGGAHGLVGATGSGKSTLMQHLNGLLRPQEGTVHVAGHDLSDAKTDLRAIRRMAGLVFQRPEVQIFEQYVGDEISYGPRLAGLAGEELRSRVRWAMDLVGLDFEGFKDRMTFALSGGEQRKVALASTLALQPRVLLLDEPTAGLDPRSRTELLARVSHLQKTGVTLILSSHEMTDITALTQRITVMDHGRSQYTGSVAEIFADGERLQNWGLAQPVVTQVAEGLRSRGWPLAVGIVDSEHLSQALAHELGTAILGPRR